MSSILTKIFLIIKSIAFNLPSLFLAMIGIGFLIAFHELGHFVFAKLFNVKVPSFSIGFGPRLIKKKIGETVFALSAIPLGGYVEIAGAHEPGQGEQKDAFSKNNRSFANKPYYQQLAILLGGILFNIVFAWAAFSALYYFGGPCLFSWCQSKKPVIYSVIKNASAAEAGLKPYDIVKSINNIEVSNIKEASNIINQYAGKTVNITIERDKTLKDTQIAIKDVVSKPKKATNNKDNTQAPKKSIGSIGALWYLKPTNFINSIKKGFESTYNSVKEIINVFISLFNFNNKNVKGQIGGPLMLFSQVSQSINAGFKVFLAILAIISINLAVFNLLPFPIFDGGQVLFYTIEAIRGKPLSIKVKEKIAYYTWLAVIILIIYLSYKDILMLIGY